VASVGQWLSIGCPHTRVRSIERFDHRNVLSWFGFRIWCSQSDATTIAKSKKRLLTCVTSSFFDFVDLQALACLF